MTDSISVFSNYKVRHLIVATLLTFLVGKLMSNFKTAMDKMAEQRIIKKNNGCIICRKSNSFMERYMQPTPYVTMHWP